MAFSPPPIPIDEAERLLSLHRCDILDTPEDESFNRLTRLASILLGVPIALISLVDAERQWFKSAVGIDIRETPRSISFCAHGILGNDIFIIPDTKDDARFAENPVVIGSPYIRFYAGVPLRASDGHKLGMFCVVDFVPRDTLRELERRILSDFAAIASDLIEIRLESRKRRALENAMAIKNAEIEARNQQFQEMLNTISPGLSVFDDDYRLVMANRAFYVLYALPVEYMEQGRSFDDFIRLHLLKRDYTGDFDAEIERVRRLALKPAGTLLYAKTAEGKNIEIRTHLLSQGGFVTTHTDITEMKRAERLKDEFISTISHELRTPLTSIAGALGVVASGGTGKLPEKAERMIAIAEKNCGRLARLVNDVLDIERMQLGRLAMTKQLTNLTLLIQQSIDTLQPYGDKYGVAFSFSPPAGPIVAEVDSDRIVQIVINLLSNAAKFSRTGSMVTVAINEGGSFVRVTVTDQGMGIPEAFRPHVFEKFAQADPSDSRKDGTGLGLNIARMIVEAHAGQIGFDSEEGKGSTFWFQVPKGDLSGLTRKTASALA